MLKNRERGDTLVEVILGLTILSVVSVGAFTVMSKGISQSLSSLEQSQVRTNVNEQTELLTYFRDQYANTKKQGGDINAYPASVWKDIKARGEANKSVSVRSFDDCSGIMSQSFYLTYDSASSPARYVVNDMTTAKLATQTIAQPGKGLWIEPKGSGQLGAANFQPYIDLYVKGCWTPLSNSNQQAVSSVVRLYDTP